MTKENFKNKIEELLKEYGGSTERNGYRTIFTFNNNTVVVSVNCGDVPNDMMLINCNKIEYSTYNDEILMYQDDVYIGIGTIHVIKAMYLET